MTIVQSFYWKLVDPECSGIWFAKLFCINILFCQPFFWWEIIVYKDYFSTGFVNQDKVIWNNWRLLAWCNNMDCDILCNELLYNSE